MKQYPCDYFKLHEKGLSLKAQKLDLSCDQLENQINAANEIIQSNFQECKESVKKNDCGMKEYCKQILSEMIQLFKVREFLKKHFEQEKLYEENPKKFDVELMGLSIWRQNEVLTNRVLHLSHSKSLAKKVMDELYEELQNCQHRDREAATDLKNYQFSVTMMQSQQKTIEDEINAEVERIKTSFAKSYFKKLKIKEQYDKIDWKMRAEILPKIAHLQNSIFCNKNEIDKINAEMEVQKEISREEDNMELKYSEKYEFLRRNLESKKEEISEMEFEIESLIKATKKLGGHIKRKKMETNAKLNAIKEDNFIFQRIKENHQSDLYEKLDEVESKTWRGFCQHDKTIRALKIKVCELCDKICHSNVIVEQLQNDIDYLMQREPKIVIGVDHTGGNFIKVNK